MGFFIARVLLYGIPTASAPTEELPPPTETPALTAIPTATPTALKKVPATKKPLPASDIQANVELGKAIALEKGIVGEQWDCFYKLGMEESGWRHTARNPTSGAYGIAQSLPASKMATHGDIHSPDTQIRWMIDYVRGRYGTMCTAYYFQLKMNWY